jgi:Fe2+ or Zn2+ uptake regulation protein
MPGETINKRQKKRKTRQKQLILEEVCRSKDHPTAHRLFERVKKNRPDIGIATVYRNLNELVLSKKIKRLTAVDGEARYDSVDHPHCHLICKGCGTIFDLMDRAEIGIESNQLEKLGFRLDPMQVEIFGYCKSCKNIY